MLKTTGKIFLHMLVWSLAYFLPYFISYGRISTAALFREPGDNIHALSTVLLIAYAYVNHYFLVPKFYLSRNFILYALAVLAGAMVVIWIPGHLGGHPGGGHPHIHPPGDGPHHDGPDMGFNRLSYNIILFVICTFASIGIRQQNQLIEMQKERLNAELSLLKAQINPHFLFNTLNSIYALSISHSEDTPKAIVQLSELMRYILKDSEADTVPLDKELNYISNYVALQKRRLGDTVRISYSVPLVPLNKKIAPLILVSFVENAFKHGVNPDQDSMINILVFIKNNQLNLSVVNNKVSSVNKEETMGIGLKNVTSRLDRLYPGTHQLTIEDSEQTFSVNLILELND